MSFPDFIINKEFFFKKKFYFKKKGFNNWENFYFSGEKFYIESLTKKNFDYAIDIGANIGHFSKLLIREFQKSSKIYAIEPQKSCLNYLKEIKKNNNNFFYYNYAISNLNGFSNIYFDTPGSQVASLIKSEKLKTKWSSRNDPILQEKIQTINFETLYKKIGIKKNSKVFIKIDAEGLEYQILENFFSHDLPFEELLFEADQDSIIKISEILDKLNKKKCYIFFILLPLNRGIKEININYLINVSKYCNLIIKKKFNN